MKSARILTILLLALGPVVWLAQFAMAAPMGTAFTYQGHLYDTNYAANGLYDFAFKLYDANVGGSKVGIDVNVADVNVIDAYFTVELDFGSGVFDGNARWLEIGVRPGASTGSFTTLSPRQKITPTPYAMYASCTKVKQLIQDFVVAAGQDVNAGDVVTFLDGYVQKGFSAGSVIYNGSAYVFNSATTYGISVAALSSTKFVVAYRDGGDSYYGTAVIGDVSGNTITYGSEYVFNSAETSFSISVAALSSTKFAVAYKDVGNSNYGTAVIGDVSGNTITYGSEYVFNSASIDHISVAALSSAKFAVAYRDDGNSNYGTAVIGNVSGNTITYGSEYVFNSAETSFNISVAALSSAKFAVAYKDVDNSNYGTAVIGDVSGNTITYGSEYVFNSANTYFISVAVLSSAKFVVAYTDAGDSDYGTAVIGDVSGNTITYGSEYVFNPANTHYISVTVLTSAKFAVAYSDAGDSYYGTAVIGDALCDQMIGVAKESKTAGQTVPVIIDGVSDVHSGLTVGEVYYSDISGNLTTGVTDWRVGPAISPTELLLDIERW